jgi:hypothetical protein
MIGLGLCRIGVGTAGVVLSYRVTLSVAALRPLCPRCQFCVETEEARRAGNTLT